MQHCDDEVLALSALGEQLSASDAAHLAACAPCRDEVAALGGLVDTVRVPVPDGPPVQPPERVWAQIAAATGVGVSPRPAADTVVEAAEPRRPRRPRRGREQTPAVQTLPRQSGSGQRRSWGPMLAVAASALVVGVAGGVAGSSLLRDEPSQPVAQVIVQVPLAALPADPGAQGRASVLNTSDGRRLQLAVSGLIATDGFYEVWLIDPEVKKMIPLGILPSTGGQFDIPAGVNLADYPIIDVSSEPLDGDPTHSGTSLLRGTIPL